METKTTMTKAQLRGLMLAAIKPLTPKFTTVKVALSRKGYITRVGDEMVITDAGRAALAKEIA